jgi:hypothetical protein
MEEGGDNDIYHAVPDPERAELCVLIDIYHAVPDPERAELCVLIDRNESV